MKIYALWEIQTHNLVDDFDNEHDALALVWENIEHNLGLADTLALNVEDEAGNITPIAHGQALAELAKRELQPARCADERSFIRNRS